MLPQAALETTWEGPLQDARKVTPELGRDAGLGTALCEGSCANTQVFLGKWPFSHFSLSQSQFLNYSFCSVTSRKSGHWTLCFPLSVSALI